MRRNGISVLLLTWLLLAASGSRAGEDVTSWQAVVQDAWGKLLDATPDCRFAVARDGVSYFNVARAFVHVIDLQNARTVLTVQVPGDVLHAAISPSGKKLAVSTQKNIFVADIATGKTSLFAEGASGMLALDDKGRLVAVMGRLPLPAGQKRADPWSVLDSKLPCIDLGVCDIGTGKWLSRTPTSILDDHPGLNSDKTLVFEGRKVWAYGTGAEELDPEEYDHYKCPDTFPCHTVLDSTTGRATGGRGVTTWYRRTPLRAEPKEEYRNYAVPSPVAEKRKTLDRARKLLAAVEERIALVRSRKPYTRTGSVGRNAWRDTLPRKPSGRLVALSDGDNLRFIAKRTFPEPLGWSAAQFTVDRDGEVSCGPISIAAGSATDSVGINCLRFGRCRGRLVGWRTDTVWPPFPRPADARPEGVLRLLDVATGRWMPSLPLGDRGETLKIVLPHGVLTYHEGKLALHNPTDGELLWAIDLAQRPTGRFSPDGDLYYLHHRDTREISVIETRTGRERFRRPYVELAGDRGRDWSVGGLGEGVILLILDKRRVVRLVGLAGTKEATEARSPEYLGGCVANWRCLPAGKGRWLVSLNYKTARLLHPDGRWGHAFPMGRFGGAKRFPALAGDRFLVQSDKGQIVLDLQEGKILQQRFSARGANFAFGERVLVRATGLLSDVEFVDTVTLETLFTLHPLPLDGKFGWIATSPDGLWDASPGAERHVAVFRNGEFSGKQGAKSRRRVGLVGQKLSTVLARALPAMPGRP